MSQPSAHHVESVAPNVMQPADPFQWPEERPDDDANAHDEGQTQQSAEDDNGAYDSELERKRKSNDAILKSRFEDIFEKYERDFSGVGDEIDLETGEIVVDNGHLEGMEHEGDPGESASGQFVRAFQEDLEQEGDSSEGSSEDSESEDGNANNVDYSRRIGASFGVGRERSAESADHQSTSASDPTIDPFLQQSAGTAHGFGQPNDASQGRASTNELSREGSASPADDSGSQTSASFNVMELPAVKERMAAFKSKSSRGRDVDPEAIQALGMSIANQIAQFMGANGKSKKRKREKKREDPAWAFPELPLDKRSRATVSPPPARPYLARLSSAISPQQPQKKSKKAEPKSSLWAPVTHPKPRKIPKKKGKAKADGDTGADNEQAEISEVAAQGMNTLSSLRQCYNCEIRVTTTWRRGPDGDLCNACGMYYYRYGLMRPSRPNTPESDSESEARDASQYSANTSRRISTSFSAPRPIRFTIEEDALIIKLKEIDHKSWEKVSSHLEGRSTYAVQCRYSKMLVGRPTAGRDALIEQGFSFNKEKGETREGGFTAQDDELLVQLREEHEMDWATIAERLPDRTAEAVESRYNLLLGSTDPDPDAGLKQNKRKPRDPERPDKHMRAYSKEEDALLLRLREVKKLPWQAVAEHMVGRSGLAIQKRYVRLLEIRKSIVSAGGDDPFAHIFQDASVADAQDEAAATAELEQKWRNERFNAHSSLTLAEERLLLRLIDEQGLEWEQAAQQIPGRSVQVLQSRYDLVHDRIDREAEAVTLMAQPDVYDIPYSESYPAPQPEPRVTSTKGGKYTAAEDKLILRLKGEEGLSWEDIALQLPWRSAASLEARWKKNLRYEDGFEPEKDGVDEGAPEPNLNDSGFQEGSSVSGPLVTAIDPTLDSGGLGPSIGEDEEDEEDATAEPRDGEERRVSLGPLERITVPAKPGSRYSDQERDILIKLRNQGFEWGHIAAQLPGRSASSVYMFWQNHVGPRASRVKQQSRSKHARQDSNRASSVPVQSSLAVTEENDVLPMHSNTRVKRRRTAKSSTSAYGGTPLKSPEAFVRPLNMVSPANKLDVSKEPVNLFHDMINSTPGHGGIRLPRITAGRYHLGQVDGVQQHSGRRSLLPSPLPPVNDDPDFDILSLQPSPSGPQLRVSASATGNAEILRSSADNSLGSARDTDHDYVWGDEDELAAQSEDEAPAGENGDEMSGNEADDFMPESHSTPKPSAIAQHGNSNEEQHNAIAGDLQGHPPPITPLMSRTADNAPTSATQQDTPVAVPTSPPITYCTPARWKQQSMPYFLASNAPMHSPVVGQGHEKNETEIPGSDATVDDNVVSPQQLAAASRSRRSATPTEDAEVPQAADHVTSAVDSATDEMPDRLPSPPGVSLGTDHPPPFSWAELVTMALKSNHDRRLPTRDIQRYLEGKFPYFRGCGESWKDTLRKFLDSTSEFERLGEAITAPWSFKRQEAPSITKPKRRSPKRKGGRPHAQTEKPASAPAEEALQEEAQQHEHAPTLVSQQASTLDNIGDSDVPYVPDQDPNPASQSRVESPPQLLVRAVADSGRNSLADEKPTDATGPQPQPGLGASVDGQEVPPADSNDLAQTNESNEDVSGHPPQSPLRSKPKLGRPRKHPPRDPNKPKRKYVRKSKDADAPEKPPKRKYVRKSKDADAPEKPPKRKYVRKSKDGSGPGKPPKRSKKAKTSEPGPAMAPSADETVGYDIPPNGSSPVKQSSLWDMGDFQNKAPRKGKAMGKAQDPSLSKLIANTEVPSTTSAGDDPHDGSPSHLDAGQEVPNSSSEPSVLSPDKTDPSQPVEYAFPPPLPSVQPSSPSIFSRLIQAKKSSPPVLYGSSATPGTASSLPKKRKRKSGMAHEARSKSASRAAAGRRRMQTSTVEIADSEDELAM
ncbi:hypothetical protein KC340_g12689 [Hortaea werneckii]|nr:hypothetical protein KC342_g12921 [Hortaea werneckii]KAI7073721.1 hypothetical protein KC339_g14165 [Hortaea werneckii]KAI7225221.1 hypothetical protein KC365_g10120 [Hortaea werneckii]KAI7302673.1 hypothetical protein KC340_g12689 [Hortaea werneckii]KAI7390287.1 hypothetical protein KC328_g8026 [Hortaea werneckii]